MHTKEELFGDPHEVASFHDVVWEATDKSLEDSKLSLIFDALPVHIRDEAHCWGLPDTCFRDQAYIELTKKPLKYNHLL